MQPIKSFNSSNHINSVYFNNLILANKSKQSTPATSQTNVDSLISAADNSSQTAQANIAAFAELPTQAAVTLSKLKTLAVEDYRTDSAALRDGHFAGQSFGTRIAKMAGRLSSRIGAMMSAAIGFVKTFSQKINSAAFALWATVAAAMPSKKTDSETTVHCNPKVKSGPMPFESSIIYDYEEVKTYSPSQQSVTSEKSSIPK